MDNKEKLKEAKRLYESANADQKYVLESLFPELKESEDEKVRKALVEMVHDTTGDSLWVDYNVHKEEALAWLEKQCKQKPQRMISAEAKEAMYNKPADTVEQKFKVKYAGSEYNVLEIKDIAGVAFYGIEDEPNHIDYVKAENCEIIDGYAIKENGSPYPTKSAVFFGAKNPAWSEMDEMNLEDSMRAIKCSNYFDFESAKENVLNWLKTLKERIGG